jgi:hypothetical protein
MPFRGFKLSDELHNFFNSRSICILLWIDSVWIETGNCAVPVSCRVDKNPLLKIHRFKSLQ